MNISAPYDRYEPRQIENKMWIRTLDLQDIFRDEQCANAQQMSLLISERLAQLSPMAGMESEKRRQEFVQVFRQLAEEPFLPVRVFDQRLEALCQWGDEYYHGQQMCHVLIAEHAGAV
jgi:hypothetical protein